MTADPIELQVLEADVIRPGDHLIVRVPGPISQEKSDELAELITVRLPMLASVFVIAGVDALHVVRGGALLTVPTVEG